MRFFQAIRSIFAQNLALYCLRIDSAAAEWRFHEVMLGAKDQVIAQYGVNSDQVQALGLKKKSERKRPVQAAKSA